MNNNKRKCILTGSGGFVGSHIKNCFINNNWEVYEFRHTVDDSVKNNKFIIPYSMEDETIKKDMFHDADVLIHCAYDFRKLKWKDIYDTNVKGSLRLLKAAKEAGVKKIIYISTVSAFEGCKSLYGKAKLEVEKEVKKLGGISIRPGLVFSKDAGGMFGALNKVTSISSIVPIIGSGNSIFYMVQIEDLCSLVFKLCTGEITANSAPILAASNQGHTFKEVLETLAQSHGKKPTFIPIPYFFTLVSLKIFETLGLKIRFKSDSLISMTSYNTKPEFDKQIQEKIQFRDFSVSALTS